MTTIHEYATSRTWRQTAARSAVPLAAAAGLMLCASSARAASACPSVDSAWFTRVSAGTTVSYGFTAEGTVQPPKNGTAFSSIGVIKLLGTSVQSTSQGASHITGMASGSETLSIGGQLTTLTYTEDTSTFTIDTYDCTGTVTRVLSNGTTAVWHIVLVDGDNTMRYIDTRSNPSVRPGVLQLMR